MEEEDKDIYVFSNDIEAQKEMYGGAERCCLRVFVFGGTLIWA